MRYSLSLRIYDMSCDGRSIIWQTVLFIRRGPSYKCNLRILARIQSGTHLRYKLYRISCGCDNKLKNSASVQSFRLALFTISHDHPFLSFSLSFALYAFHQLNPRPGDSIKTPRHEAVIFFIAMRKSGTRAPGSPPSRTSGAL